MVRFSTSEWDRRWLDLAFFIANWSKDPSTKVGSVIASHKDFVSLGYNGFPRYCDDHPSLYDDREKKYPRIVHAEANALLATRGRDLENATIYSTLFPCCSCAGLIINSGLRRIVTTSYSEDQKSRWGNSFEQSVKMFQESSTIVDIVKLPAAG